MGMYINIIENEKNNQKIVVSAQFADHQYSGEGKLVEIFDTNLFEFICENLVQKFHIYFDGSIKLEDLKISDLIVNENKTSKNYYIFAIESQMMRIMGTIPNYSYFRFQYLNNIFASKGIFITVDNREESYIKILEMDDPVLMDFLEEYLNVMNRLIEYEKLYSRYLTAIDELKNTDDDEKMKEIYEDTKNVMTVFKTKYANYSDKGYFSSLQAKYERT